MGERGKDRRRTTKDAPRRSLGSPLESLDTNVHSAVEAVEISQGARRMFRHGVKLGPGYLSLWESMEGERESLLMTGPVRGVFYQFPHTTTETDSHSFEVRPRADSPAVTC